MDILFIVIIFAIGYLRVATGATVLPATNIVVNEVTGEVKEDVHEDIPIGNNIMLNSEVGAFMKIVKELNLK